MLYCNNEGKIEKGVHTPQNQYLSEEKERNVIFIFLLKFWLMNLD
jgi:hypothetical protein